MRIERRYTKAEILSPYEAIEFRTTRSEIRDPDGSTVFAARGLRGSRPAWSQVAADVLAQTYFRKAGVPARLKPVEEADVPSWLWRRVADEAALDDLPKTERYVSEILRPPGFDRLAGTWTYWGWKGGYSDSVEDARAFYDELRYMLASRWPRPIGRNGSTPACTGPMASTARARAIIMSILVPACSSKSTSAPSIRSRMPVSSNRSPTIWSTKAAS